MKRLVLLLGAVAFATRIATAAVPISELRAKAEQGDALAQLNLGIRYDNGTGVETDHVEAAKWYLVAAVQNFSLAQLYLGDSYANGRGVVKDDVEAAKWYLKAAELGLADAQNSLGVSYANGQGVNKDEVEAVKWYRKAAQQGLAEAQFNLGISYVKGIGVAKDHVEAYALLNLAAVTNQDGRRVRETLEKNLSREEIAAGQRRTRELQREIEAKSPAAAAPAIPQLGLVATGAVQVTLRRKNADDSVGEMVYTGFLAAGESRYVPRQGALFVEASVAENLELEINGKRYNLGQMLGTGPRRGNLPAP